MAKTGSERTHRTRGPVTFLAGVGLAGAGLVGVGLAVAGPAGALPSPSITLANTFAVQCQSDGAITTTGKLTLSAAGPATVAVGDTITVSDYTVSLAVDNIPLDTSVFKGATPTLEIGGTFAAKTLTTGAQSVGPVDTMGTLGRAALSPAGATVLSGGASAPISFQATTPGDVEVTSASPFTATLTTYLTGLTPASGQSLPAGAPTPSATTAFGTTTLQCTGNPVLPWGAVHVTANNTQPAVAVGSAPGTPAPGHLAFTGSPTQTVGVIGGWALVGGVAFTFYGRRRRTA